MENITSRIAFADWEQTAATALNDWDVRKQIRLKNICFEGNKKLKIYDTMHCTSGKRLKKENRVFFATAIEAKQSDFRLCGHGMKPAYIKMEK